MAAARRSVAVFVCMGRAHMDDVKATDQELVGRYALGEVLGLGSTAKIRLARNVEDTKYAVRACFRCDMASQGSCLTVSGL